MIELLRTEELDEALLFASEHLAPLGEEHPHLLSELEQTMSLFVFDMRSPPPAMPAYATELYDTEYRKRVAEELNAAILASQSYSPTARLARLAALALLFELRRPAIIVLEHTDYAHTVVSMFLKRGCKSDRNKIVKVGFCFMRRTRLK